MVLVQGKYQISELAAALIGCVVLFMGNCNLLPLQHPPDLPGVLFVLSSVILLHHLRVVRLPPVQELWRFLAELLCFYLATQMLILVVWDQFHNLLNIVRDSLMNTRPVLNLLVNTPKVFVFMRQNFCYLVQVLVALITTHSAVMFTQAMDYALPGRRQYQYIDCMATDGIFQESWKPAARKRRPGFKDSMMLSELQGQESDMHSTQSRRSWSSSQQSMRPVL